MDDKDYEWLKNLHWRLEPRSQYAMATVILSRIVMNAPPDKWVDHKNRKRLDCQRANLRLCTPGQNNANRRPRRGTVKGVYKQSFAVGSGKKGTPSETRRYTRKKPWVAQIHTNGRHLHLGCFRTRREASQAYKQAARKYHGEFAYAD